MFLEMERLVLFGTAVPQKEKLKKEWRNRKSHFNFLEKEEEIASNSREQNGKIRYFRMGIDRSPVPKRAVNGEGGTTRPLINFIEGEDK